MHLFGNYIQILIIVQDVMGFILLRNVHHWENNVQNVMNGIISQKDAQQIILTIAIIAEVITFIESVQLLMKFAQNVRKKIILNGNVKAFKFHNVAFVA